MTDVLNEADRRQLGIMRDVSLGDPHAEDIHVSWFVYQQNVKFLVELLDRFMPKREERT
jgi:hypothetical protein